METQEELDLTHNIRLSNTREKIKNKEIHFYKNAHASQPQNADRKKIFGKKAVGGHLEIDQD